MGMIWDLIQQCQIQGQRSQLDQYSATISARTASIDDRVRAIEQQLTETRSVLDRLIIVLEQRLDEDLNRDGHVGR